VQALLADASADDRSIIETGTFAAIGAWVSDMGTASRIVVAVCLAACTPATRSEPMASEEPPASVAEVENPPPVVDDEGEPPEPTPLVLVAEFSSPVSGGSATIVVYDDGRAFMRGGEGDDPSRSWAGRVTAAELATLQRALSSAPYRKSEPHYDEDGALDGGAVVLADPISDRKIVVVNDPPLPTELAEVHRFASELYGELLDAGRDPFDRKTPTELRMLAFHRQSWTKSSQSFDFVVYADGKLELCKTDGDDRWGPNDESRYPACRVRTVALERLAPLQRLLARKGLARAPKPNLDAEGDTVHVLQLRGFTDWLRFADNATMSPDLRAVLDELMTLRRDLETP
jgi:hypothetical protein